MYDRTFLDHRRGNKKRITLVPSAGRLLRSEKPSSSLPKTPSREIVDLMNS
jgi:hypothetical protein